MVSLPHGFSSSDCNMLFPKAYYLFLCSETLVVEISHSEKKSGVAGWFVEKRMIDVAEKQFVMDKNVEYDQVGHTYYKGKGWVLISERAHYCCPLCCYPFVHYN
ncbi:hypothetical protein ACFX14_024736 [Malus domestica]